MARTGFFHHIGTFLIFAAAILLLITTITAPVVNDLSMLRVDLKNGSIVEFGTFGHCVRDVASTTAHQDVCTGKHIGYNPAQIMSSIDQTVFDTAATDSTKALTRVMILHPIACGLAFIAFLLALGAGFFGAILSSLVATVAWIVALVVMACDFVLFGIIKRHVDHDGTGSTGKYGVGIWTLLAAMVALFFGTIVVLFTCCSARMHERRDRVPKNEAGYANGTTTTRRRFWQRRQY